MKIKWIFVIVGFLGTLFIIHDVTTGNIQQRQKPVNLELKMIS
jgi:hypothetical protein